MDYRPSIPPSDPARLPAYLQEEFRRIQQALIGKRKAVKFEILHTAPEKFEEGDVVYADGTDWNPGSGAGLYKRTSAAWVAL